MKAAGSLCANKRDSSTDIHKLTAHVESRCCLELIPCEFLKYEITNT